MQKRRVRNDIEFLGQPKPRSANEKPDVPKKSWAHRNPLPCGIIIIGIASAVAFSNIHGCGGRPEKAKPALKSKNAEEEMKTRKKKEMRKKMNELKDIIKAQRMIINSGWSEKIEKTEKEEAAKKREMHAAEEKLFREELEDKTKDELLALLSAQDKIIDELRAEYGQDGPDTGEERDLLAHEEMKKGDIADHLDEKKIEERGFYKMPIEELQEILMRYDSLAIAGNEDSYGMYTDFEEERRLVIKAISRIEEIEMIVRYGPTIKG